MSIYFSGALRRSQGIVSAIGKQIKRVNLKGVQRVTVTFDPFADNVKATREFLFLLSTPKVAQTNPNCVIKTDIVCDRKPAEVKFSLIGAVKEQAKVKEVRFLSENLNTLELLQLCNKHISVLAPAEDIAKHIKSLTPKKVVKKK